MASTLTSDDVASTVQARARDGVNVVVGTYELSAALVVDDVIQMVKIPQGATVVETLLMTDDLDSDGTPAIVLDVGDVGDDDRFIADTDIAQAGGTARMNAIAGIGYKYTEEDTIDVSVSTAPATGATSGTITLAVTYHMEGFN